jgi:hypothetical protein
LAQGEAQVLQEIIDGREGPAFAILLARLFDAAELQSGDSAGLVHRHAGSHQVINVHLQMTFDLIVEILPVASVCYEADEA